MSFSISRCWCILPCERNQYAVLKFMV
jgi:hypothetical protein